MEAIQTEYNGYKFRSRLEARWAVFFDSLNIKYVYEPEGYEFNDGQRYLPDFFFPEYELFAEVKGVMNNESEQKIEKFAFEGNKKICVLDSYFFENGCPLYSRGEITKCDICGEGECINKSDIFFKSECEKSYNVDSLSVCGCIPFYDKFRNKTNIWLGAVPGEYDMFLKDDKILSAIMEAKKARFEHGETPKI